ncbi:acyl-CoA reductase [Nicoliella spurrieriana]|uniref:Acyl-CoA reductase n=1 Tax=Nicoliella spurrieriana TaxID=2925830 RepID=A0A976RTB7_9LACO|nr:acyl-CoA reductase [Nicoliella spurrieriana]UQS87443.1 acyl-CoA reductase [Nicoliella spurrieriana]
MPATIKIIPLDIFKLPDSISVQSFRYQSVTVGTTVYSLRYPVIDADAIAHTARLIEAHQQSDLAKRTVAEIIDVIDRAIQLWTQPQYPQRCLAMQLIPVLTGYNAETVALEMKRFVRVFRKKELLRFVDTELDQPGILDQFHPQKIGSSTKAFGPNGIFHVFSGNIPGLQIWPLVMGMLVKSANLGKTSLAEPLFPILFMQSIAAIDQRLADCVAIMPWQGGTTALERAAIDNTDATIVYGSNRAVEGIRKLVPTEKRFLHYGYKISFAMVGKEALTAEYYPKTVKRAVEDVAVYDQQSCLSAQAIFVERNGAVTPHQFAKLVATELQNYQLKRPRAQLTTEEAAAIVRLRNEYQLKRVQGASVDVIESAHDTSWTVIFHDHPGFANSPLNRTVNIFAIGHLEDVNQYLAQYQQFLQSCGLAVAPERVFPLANQLGRIGVDRVSALGEMTRAKPGWHHDGGFNLLSLLHFVDVERNAEDLAEHYDPDVE